MYRVKVWRCYAIKVLDCFRIALFRFLKPITAVSVLAVTVSVTGCTFQVGGDEYRIDIPFLDANSNQIDPFEPDYNVKDVGTLAMREASDLDLEGPKNSNLSKDNGGTVNSNGVTVENLGSSENSVENTKEWLIIINPVGSIKEMDVTTKTMNQYFTTDNVLPVGVYKIKSTKASKKKDFIYRYPYYFVVGGLSYPNEAGQPKEKIDENLNLVNGGGVAKNEKEFKKYFEWVTEVLRPKTSSVKGFPEYLKEEEKKPITAQASLVSFDESYLKTLMEKNIKIKKSFLKEMSDYVSMNEHRKVSGNNFIGDLTCFRDSSVKTTEFANLLGYVPTDFVSLRGKSMSDVIRFFPDNYLAANEYVGCYYGSGDSTIYETDVVYYYCSLLKDSLVKAGYNTYYTREEITGKSKNVPTLKERVKAINKKVQECDTLVITVEAPYYDDAIKQKSLCIEYEDSYSDAEVDGFKKIVSGVQTDFGQSSSSVDKVSNNYLLNKVNGAKYCVNLCLGDLSTISENITKAYENENLSFVDNCVKAIQEVCKR